MFTVYVLFSSNYDKIYIGESANLIGRFQSHNQIATKGWTVLGRFEFFVARDIFLREYL
jgi:predicted GIY-YIG superfamily endonuclease